jgi:AraC-like DNA-binding protein
MNTTLYIKNMVCDRCIKVVNDEFTKLGLNINEIKLGKVIVDNDIDTDIYGKLKNTLENNGFELIDDKKSQIIDNIKTKVIKYVHYGQEIPDNRNFSDFLASEIGYDYSYLSSLFSSVQGVTIEKYMIRQKVEKVKEMLAYDQLNISEIAWKLGYSSVHHLSSQFKKIVGMNPSEYKKLKVRSRKPLDKV